MKPIGLCIVIGLLQKLSLYFYKPKSEYSNKGKKMRLVLC